MCGIAGIIDTAKQRRAEELIAIGKAMADVLAHRGPDDEGTWLDAESGVVLAHRRLAIIDPSPAGHQPMTSASGRWVITFNGEIYNFRELAAELESTGATFGGHSDTEVLLAAIEAWGVERSLQRFDGMFAFAVWDRHRHTLTLARDRIGEKPLYYGVAAGDIVFASELKSIRVHPDHDRQLDRDAIALMFRHKYIPAPRTIYRRIAKLPPGCFVEIPSCRGPVLPTPRAYWTLLDAVRTGQDRPFMGTAGEAVDETERHVRAAVASRMVADVPIGALLSSGIDSSLVVAMMQDLSSTPVRTFTIGFHESDLDEAEFARSIATHLGTDHTELYVSAQDALSVVPDLPSMYDEPFADSSQVPTSILARLARGSVMVSLTGDGGDEFFAGYGRYRRIEQEWANHWRIPSLARRPAAFVRTVALNRRHVAGASARNGPAYAPVWRRRSERVREAVVRRLDVRPIDDFYRDDRSVWDEPEAIVLGASARPSFTLAGPAPRSSSILDRLMYLDQVVYLPDDILVKVDRATMAVGLEVRAPLLAPDLIEFSWTLPSAYKVRDGLTKWPLRQTLRRQLPEELISQKKKGFSIPIDQWLRGPLREWAAELLCESRLRRSGYLEPEPIRRKWMRHLDGHENCGRPLWTVLMFEAWLDEERRAGVRPAR